MFAFTVGFIVVILVAILYLMLPYLYAGERTNRLIKGYVNIIGVRSL